MLDEPTLQVLMSNQAINYVGVLRTKNAVEGWHNAFSSAFSSSNMDIILLSYKPKEWVEVIQ